MGWGMGNGAGGAPRLVRRRCEEQTARATSECDYECECELERLLPRPREQRAALGGAETGSLSRGARLGSRCVACLRGQGAAQPGCCCCCCAAAGADGRGCAWVWPVSRRVVWCGGFLAWLPRVRFSPVPPSSPSPCPPVPSPAATHRPPPARPTRPLGALLIPSSERDTQPLAPRGDRAPLRVCKSRRAIPLAKKRTPCTLAARMECRPPPGLDRSPAVTLASPPCIPRRPIITLAAGL